MCLIDFQFFIQLCQFQHHKIVSTPIRIHNESIVFQKYYNYKLKVKTLRGETTPRTFSIGIIQYLTLK